MVADFEEGRILGELQDLEDEINLLQVVAPATDDRKRIFERLIKRLEDSKYHQELRLKIHRQKVKESGIKY